MEFHNVDPLEMNFKAKFDVAMAIFVLQFAEDASELQKVRSETTAGHALAGTRTN